MKVMLIAMMALMLALPNWANAQDDAEAVSEAERAAAREALREEIEQARREVAEAARELARVQRKLADADIETVHVERLRAFEQLEEMEEREEFRALESEMAGMGERIRREVVRGLRMTRPRLGVLLGDEDDANAIVGVTPGSGAEKAGIESGDRLVSINGQAVDASDSRSLRTAMAGVDADDTIPVEIERDGERLSLDVTVSSPARNVHVITHDIKGPPAAPDAPHAPRMDREVIVLEGGESRLVPEHPLPPRLAGLGRHSDMISNHAGLESYFGTAQGVVVLRIDSDNPLQLRDGDVVLSIDGEAVSRPVEIGRTLLGRSGSAVSLDVMRDGERVTIEATLPEGEHLSLLAPRGIRGF